MCASVCASIEIDRKLAGKVFLVFATIYLLFLSVVLRVLFPLSPSFPPTLETGGKTNERASRQNLLLHTFRLSALVCEKKISHPPHAVVALVAFVVVALVYFSVKLKYAFFMGSLRFFAALSHDPATQRCPLARPSLSLSVGLPPHLLSAF